MKNIKLKLSSFLMAILMTGTGFTLAGCGVEVKEKVATADEATPDEATPDEATPDEATPDEATPDEAKTLVQKLYPKYEKTFKQIQQGINIPSYYLENKEVLELLKQKVDEHKGEYHFDHNATFYYTTDEQIGFSKKENELEIKTEEEKINVLKEITINTDEEGYYGFIFSVSYLDQNGSSIKFNDIDETGFGGEEYQFDENNSDLYTFYKYEELDGSYYTKEIDKKEFNFNNSHQEGDRVTSTVTSCEMFVPSDDKPYFEVNQYQNINYFNKQNDKSITIYTKDNVVKEYNEIFDKYKVSEFDSFINNLNNIQEKGKTYVKQKGLH